MSKKKELKCVWMIGGVECGGSINEVVIFNGQITIPICEEHLKHHKIILALDAAGIDINETLALSPDERIKMVEDMGLTLDRI